jgi:hypothetical protein
MTTKTITPQTTSFGLWLATFGTGLAGFIQAIVSPTSTVHDAIFGGGGAAVALFSTLIKLWHDKGLSIATLQAGAHDVAEEWPTIKTDVEKVISFVENDIPGVKGTLTDIGQRLSALEAKAGVPIADVENALRKLLNTDQTATPTSVGITTTPTQGK